LREQLAEISGDVDGYVGVLAENLNSAVQYLRIVNVLRDAVRLAEAIAGPDAAWGSKAAGHMLAGCATRWSFRNWASSGGLFVVPRIVVPILRA
jgi:hypothetical protein